MMIVDLVDERDFNEKLIALGVAITPDSALDETKDAVLAWLADNEEGKAALRALFETLGNGEITVLPEVKTMIEELSAALN